MFLKKFKKTILICESKNFVPVCKLGVHSYQCTDEIDSGDAVLLLVWIAFWGKKIGDRAIEIFYSTYYF